MDNQETAQKSEKEPEEEHNKTCEWKTKKVPNAKDPKAIEADLRRMLNINTKEHSDEVADGQAHTVTKYSIVVTKEDLPNFGNMIEHKDKVVYVQSHSSPKHGVVFTKDDLTGLGKPLPNAKQTTKKKKEKKQKKGHEVTENTEHQHPVEQQGDPEGAAEDTDNAQMAKKKKKKKSKKKKKQEESLFGGIKLAKMVGDSDEESETEQNKSQPEKTNFNSMKYLDDNLTAAILNELEAERIFPLKKKSSSFVHAKYFCRLCDYHCDNIPVCRQHASDARHKRRKEIMLQDQLLRRLPLPSERHIQSLDEMVDNIFKENSLTDEDMAHRQAVVKQTEELIMGNMPEARLCLYGSSLTGLGLKTSDVNMDLVLPVGSNPARGLTEVFRLISQSETFKDVRSDFQSKVPSVLFTSPDRTLQCQITIGSELACQTSQLLAIYSKLDIRLKKLAVIFKRWAQVCQVDKQDCGSLPSYSFGLMTVFFLQQCKPPVLPVLWKDLSEVELKRPKTKEDVENMLKEFQQKSWTSDNVDSVGVLWKEMLMFYGMHFDLADKVICIRSLELLPRSEKKWKSKRVAIEDPFSSKRNVARSMSNLRMFDYFYNCLRKAGLYFSLPTTHQNVSKYYDSKRHTTNTAKEKEHQSKSKCKGISQKQEDETGKSELSDEVIIQKSTNNGSEEEQDVQGEAELDPESSENNNDFERNEIVTECTTNGTESSSDCSIIENKFFEDCRLGQYKTVSDFESSISKSDVDLDRSTDHDEIVEGLKNQTLSDQTDVVESAKCPSCMTESLEVSEVKTSCARCGQEKLSTECDKCCSLDDDVNDSDNKTHKVEKRSFLNLCSKCKTLAQDNVGQKISDDIDDSNEMFSDNDAGVNTDNNNCSDADDEELSKIQEKIEESKSAMAVKREIVVYEKDTSNDINKSLKNNSEDLNNKLTDKQEEKESDSELETDTESGSGSDMENESVDSSPLVNRKRRVSSPLGAEYDFQFNYQTLTDGKGPAVICPICEKEGHLKMSCPDDKPPELEQLPPMTKTHIQQLSLVVKQVPKDFKLTQREIDDREFIRKDLELHIQELYPDAQLRLFGSSMNGFGFHQSDLDICVTFKGKEPAELNFVEHIEAICKKMKAHRGLYGVFPITTAKVPIVKFKHRGSQLEGDISMYNVLAMQNTQLLSMYASIDARVQTLGFAIKVFAKVCDIGDASKGSLSSYAYMLMMIHYLQHTKPPLVPVLQELRFPNNPNPEFLVEGWNTWFFDSLNDLPKVWSGCGKNNQSVGELWEGFFCFYLEEFSFSEQVVSIRQFQPLTKFEKLWNGSGIAIEDPFDLSHNLGGGLSRNMNQYILKTFVNARKLYGTPVEKVPEGYPSIQDYFFDKRQLVNGEPPSDRLCRVCSKIGHIAKECPRLLARKERNAAEKQRKAEMKKLDEQANKAGGSQQATPRQNKDKRERVPNSRSLSDPSSEDRSFQGQGQQKAYHRQHSHNPGSNSHQERHPQNMRPASHSPDKRLMRPQPGFVNPNYHGNPFPQSPNSPRDFQPNLIVNWHHQNNSPRAQGSPGPSSMGFVQSPAYHSGQQHPHGNHNNNSSPRYGGPGQRRYRNGPQPGVNRNFDLRQQDYVMQGDINAYPPSPLSDQQRPVFRSQNHEGSRQTSGRRVNVQRSGNKEHIPNVGVTVRNEYYKGKGKQK